MQLTTRYPAPHQINWNIPLAHNQNAPFFSFQYLIEAIVDIKTWALRADANQIDISEQLGKIRVIVDNMPQLNYPESHLTTEIVLIYQNKMHRFFLCELVRVYTQKVINKFKTDGLQRYPLDNLKCKIKSIQVCNSYHWLSKRLPEPLSITLYPINYEDHVVKTIETCSEILDDIENARYKLDLLRN